MDHLTVTYHLDVPAEAAEPLAASVLLEQTVETPRAVAMRDPFVRTHMMGRLLDLRPALDGGFLAKLALPAHTCTADPAQFVNVLFGNVSLHTSVSLVDFEPPQAAAALFRGPGFGIDGLRRLTGVVDRALTCAALKPIGLTPEAIAELCGTLAVGGIDLIKDDHYYADHPFSPFKERVRRCQAAVQEAAAKTGHRALYVPSLSGTPDAVRQQAETAQALGVQAVMIAPMVLGLPAFYALTHGQLDLPVLAHPSFAGARRMAHPALFGKLLRLYGADAVIFTNYGGRFGYSRAACLAIAETMRQPWGPYAPSLPTPAGGMTVERAPELAEAFGPDTLFLIGGSLLEEPDGILRRARAFAQSIAEAPHPHARPA